MLADVTQFFPSDTAGVAALETVSVVHMHHVAEGSKLTDFLGVIERFFRIESGVCVTPKPSENQYRYASEWRIGFRFNAPLIRYRGVPIAFTGTSFVYPTEIYSLDATDDEIVATYRPWWPNVEPLQRAPMDGYETYDGLHLFPCEVWTIPSMAGCVSGIDVHEDVPIATRELAAEVAVHLSVPLHIIRRVVAETQSIVSGCDVVVRMPQHAVLIK